MAGRLPSVTEYVKNMGKSVAYATIDIVKEPTENMSDFLETNDDLFKVIYSAAKNYKDTIKVVDRSIKSSKIYTAAMDGFGALKEDLKTGKLYNVEREKEFGLASMGEDFADFSDFESDGLNFNFDDDDFFADDEDNKPSAAKVIAQTSAGLGDVISYTSKTQSNVIVSSAEAISNVNIASAKMLTAQTEKINASLITGFTGVNAGMGTVVSILSGPMTTYMNESTKFYGDVSNKLSETNAYLKELTEMQRNLYKDQSTPYKTSKFDEVVGASGTPDLLNYAKRIYKNILDLDPTGGMFSGDKDENLFKAFVGSPLKAIPTMIAKMIVPATVTKALEEFDKNISGVFSAFIARMNTWAEEDFIDEGINIRGAIGRLLGIKIDNKKSVNVGRYDRGPMPFDGETKKAIVDVIPAYLARIESAVSGMPERVFDGKSGTFKTIRQVEKEYQSIAESAAISSVSSIQETFDKWAYTYSNGMKNADQAEKNRYYNELKGNFKKLGKRVYNDGGDIRPYMGMGTSRAEERLEDKFYDEIGMDEDAWKSFMKYLKDNNKHGMWEISRNTIEARQRVSRELEAMEGRFGLATNALFDGRLNGLNKQGKYSNYVLSQNSNYFDQTGHFKTASDYLRDILAEVRYIRQYSFKGIGGGRRKKKDYTPPSFENYYKDFMGQDIFSEEEKIETRNWTVKEPKEMTEAEKYGLTKENIAKTRPAKGFVEHWELAKKAVDKMLHAPSEFVVRVLQNADKRMFDVMFGDEENLTFKDKHGIPYTGLLDYMVIRAERIFDDFQERMKKSWDKFTEWFGGTKVGKWVMEKGGNFARGVKNRLGSKFGFIKDRIHRGYNDTYGNLIDHMRGGHIFNADDIQSMVDPDTGIDIGQLIGVNTFNGSRGPRMTQQQQLASQYEEENDAIANAISNMQHSAYGRIAKKYGLTMLSPGEIVIPNPTEAMRRKNLAGEKREKSRILRALRGGKIDHHAGGTIINNGVKEESTILRKLKDIIGEISGNEGGADIVADALLGGGFSLLTGMIGGPLLGAAVGAGIGITKHSETVQKALFGEIGQDGERKGGLISKETQDKFTSIFKNKGKDMVDFGIAGGIAGLFTPLGLVGGMLAGATFGYAKNTDWFQETMFGDATKGKKGLMSPETKAKLEKAFPRMALGAGAGILLGPFGLVGNTILGSAAGFITTTDTFKEALFGKEGDQNGGIVGAIKAGLVEPLKERGKQIAKDLKGFAEKHIIDPTKTFIKGSGQFVRNIFLSIGDRVADGLNGIFEKHLGLPISEFLREKVFKRISSALGGIVKIPLAIGKAVVGAPFAALGAVGNTLMAGQIGRGTMDTMTATERLDFRKKHKVRFARMGAMGRDKTADLDEILANADENELQTMLDNINTFTKNRGSKNKAYNELMDTTGNKVSALFDNKEIWKNKGHGLIVNAHNYKKNVMKAIYDGDFVKAAKHLRNAGLTEEEVNEFMSTIDQQGMIDARKAMVDESKLDANAISLLEKATGYGNLHKSGNRYLKQLARMTDTELAARRVANASNENTEQTTEDNQTDIQSETSEKITKLLDVVVNINNSLIEGNKKGKRRPKQGRIYNSDGTPMGTVTTDIPDEDTKTATDARKKQEDKDKQQEEMVKNTGSLVESIKRMLGIKENGEDDDGEVNFATKAFNMIGGIGSKVSSFLSGTGSKIGLAAAAVGAVSLIGYGSEFVKKNLLPALEGTGLYKTLKGVGDSIQDGSFFIKLGDKVSQALTYGANNLVGPLVQNISAALPNILGKAASGIAQGLVFAGKNLLGPLMYGLFKALPKIGVGLLSGIGSAIKAAFGGKPKSTTIDLNEEMKLITTGMPVGKYESEFAKEFNNTDWNAGNLKSVTYTPDFSSNNSGFDMEREDRGFASRMAENAFNVALATGKSPSIIRGITNIGRKLFSSKSIGKSAANIVTGGNKPLSLLNRIGSMFATAGKTAGRAVTEAGGASAELGSTIHNIAQGNTTIGSKLSKFGGGLANSIKTNFSNSKFGKTAAGQIVSNLTEAATTNLSNLTKSIGNKLSDSSVGLGIKKACSFLGDTIGSKILSMLKTGTTSISKGILKKKFEDMGTKLAAMVAKKGATAIAGKVGTKILTAIGNVTPLGAIFWITSFAEGAWFETETILGITKNSNFIITIPIRVIVGILNALNENLLFGIIDTGSLLDLLMSIFGDFLGINKEALDKAQTEAEQLLASSDYESLAEYNNQHSLFKKFGKFIGNLNPFKKKDNNTHTTETEFSGGRRYAGYGRGGQQGGIYAGMRYGNSTIGEAGCAPVAAASMLGSNIPEAARFAQRTGHVAADGSTDIGYFRDYFSAKGIPNTTTTNKSDVSRALNNGGSAVMLGRDPNGGYNSAYSNSSHYITARGDRNGNVIVNDPALGIRRMSKNKVLANMKASVLTGKGRMTVDEAWSTSNKNNKLTTTHVADDYMNRSGLANAQKIIKMAESQIGYVEKSGNYSKYGAEYGWDGVYWCVIFVWWVFKHAGASKLFFGGKKTASCTELKNYYAANNQIVTTIKPGDLVFFNFNGGKNTEHIGIAVSASGDKVTTIDGNTGNTGSQSNGDGVYKKTRNRKFVVAVARPAYSGSVFDDAIPDDYHGMNYNYSTGEYEDTESMSLFERIADFGKTALKSIFGENLYNAMFGGGESSSNSVSTDPSVDSNADNAGILTGSNNAQKIWTYLRSKGYSRAGTAGIMGSLMNESGLRPNNLQDTYNKSLGFTDAAYTKAINSGKYSRDKFMNDAGGYGLAQWTYNTRKGGLYDATVGNGKSIDDMKSQLDYLDKEVTNTGNLGDTLRRTDNISEANTAFIQKFEKPYGYENTNSALYSKRLKSAQEYYNEFKGTGRGYASKVNTKYTNETGRARDSSTVVAGAGTVSYTAFLQTIVNILLSISDNTEALSKILEILSNNFNINVETEDVKKAASSSKKRAREALNQMMGNKADAEEVANILQSKDTNYLINVMTSIARE